LIQDIDHSFSFWYQKFTEVYAFAPRTYLELEIKYLDQEIIKMGRKYEPKLVAQHYAAKDMHHVYYDGRKRDPARDDTVSRGPMYTGQGRKDSRQRLGYSSQPDQLANG
jgi:hypothetical protein